MRLSPFVALLGLTCFAPLAFGDASIAMPDGAGPLICRPESALPRPYAKMNQPATVRVGGDGFGTLTLDEPHHRLRASVGKAVWSAPIPGVWGDSLDAIVDGDRLFVAIYSPATGGAALISFDLWTGRRLWTGDVAGLEVAHSEYWNVVTIDKRGSEIILRGDEAGGCTVQSFDAKTGKRRLNLSHRKW